MKRNKQKNRSQGHTADGHDEESRLLTYALKVLFHWLRTKRDERVYLTSVEVKRVWPSAPKVSPT